MTETGSTAVHWEAALEIWRRRRWLAIPAFVLPFAGITTFVASLPNVYKSSAVVLVERQQVPEEFVKSTVTSGVDTRLQTISQEILSRGRLEPLLQRFNLYPELRANAPSEVAVNQMRREIDLQLRGMESGGRGAGTVAFTIGYQGFDPVTVASVANTLASSYVEENTRVRERQASGTADFLRRQLESTKDRLDAQERKVSDFKKRFLGETPQQLGANLAILERLNTELRRNADQQTRSMQRRGVIEAQMGLAAQLAETERRRARDSAIPALPDRTGGAASPGEMVDPLAERLAKLQAELAELRTRFSDRYPDVMAKKAEIATVAQQLREAPPARAPGPGPAPVALPASAASPAADAVATPAFVPRDPTAVRLQQTLLEIDGELRSLKDEEARLRQTVATYQGRIENAPRREQEFEEISRDYDTTRELYRTLLKRYEEAQLAESLEQRQKGEQFRIVQPALPSSIPAAPKRDRLLLVGLVLSAGLGAGAMLLAEQLDTSFHTTDALRLGVAVPLVGVVPVIVTVADRRRQRRRMRAGVAAVTAAVALVVIGSHWIGTGAAPVLGPLAQRLVLGN